MTERPEYTVLTERDDAHHVVIKREGSEWFHRVATFARKDRAEDYAEIENASIYSKKALNHFETPEPPPDIPLPPSAIKPENFKPPEGKVAGADHKPESPVVSEAAPAIDLKVNKPVHLPGDPPPKPKPLTENWDNSRDPLIARNGHDAPKTVEMPKGSPGQQLADLIAAEFSDLMTRHIGGPTWAGLATEYGASEPRVREAIQYLVSTKRARYAIPDGAREAHLVPYGWEEKPPAPKKVSTDPRTSEEKRTAVLAVLRAHAKDGEASVSLTAMAAESDIPVGSISYHLGVLTRRGLINQSRQADARDGTPASYRIIEQGA